MCRYGSSPAAHRVVVPALSFPSVREPSLSHRSRLASFYTRTDQPQPTDASGPDLRSVPFCAHPRRYGERSRGIVLRAEKRRKAAGSATRRFESSRPPASAVSVVVFPGCENRRYFRGLGPITRVSAAQKEPDLAPNRHILGGSLRHILGGSLWSNFPISVFDTRRLVRKLAETGCPPDAHNKRGHDE
jgi:hypothetical protein